MLPFWSIAALLLAAALLFVLPPLRRLNGGTGVAAGSLALRVVRDQAAELDAALAAGTLAPQEHAAEREALARRALDEAVAGPAAPSTTAMPRGLVGALALALPALSLGLYLLLGAPASLQPAASPAAAAASANAHALGQEQMQAMVEGLAERLKREPGDGEGWHMLARSYVAFGRYPEAAQAYDRAVALLPPQAGLLADQADTLALVNGRRLDGKPEELVNAALQLDPRHPKALALAGTAAFNRQDYAAAVGFWERLLATQPADSDGAKRASASLAQARAGLAGGATMARAPAAPAAVASAAPGASAAAASVSGQVLLAPALQARLAGGETLFVFARAVNGPRMPLAIVRQPAGAFPLPFRLDDSQAMSPQLRLSGQVEVMLGARISRSGNATPQSGDLMGTLGPVKVGSGGLQLVIDGVVP